MVSSTKTPKNKTVTIVIPQAKKWPDQLAGVPMTMEIWSCLVVLHRYAAEVKVDECFNLQAIIAQGFVYKVVDAGLFELWDSIGIRAKFTPMGKRLWGTFLLYQAARE